MMVYSDWLKDQIKDHVHDIKNFTNLLDYLDLNN